MMEGDGGGKVLDPVMVGVQGGVARLVVDDDPRGERAAGESDQLVTVLGLGHDRFGAPAATPTPRSR